ncbi:translation initiation factor IF-2-like isoform X3 [Canis lupus familiaris]|uniref:translation initiation factor IF-2-like isoform X3 n=1 Tax=Canis lupus familiaris TaxID=9615 RepID=UPI0018F5B804|nr:translation initiation factor IF-2-like isoform X3 [Canis lupus familiaris]
MLRGAPLALPAARPGRDEGPAAGGLGARAATARGGSCSERRGLGRGSAAPRGSVAAAPAAPGPSCRRARASLPARPPAAHRPRLRPAPRMRPVPPLKGQRVPAGPPPPAPDPRPKLALGGGRRWSSPLSPLSGRGGAAEDVYDVPHGARSARRPAAGNFLKEAPRGGPQRVGARARPGGPGPRRHPQSDSPRDLLQVSSPRGPRFPPLSAEQSHLNSNMETTGAGSGRKELSERRQLSPCALRLLPSLPPGDHHP